MPYFKISVNYGEDQEFYIKADSMEDAEVYAGDVELEAFVSVDEVCENLEDDTIDDNIATEEE